MEMLKTISEARSFRNYMSVGGIDAVLASTSPARWMDAARADAAVDAVEDLYGSISLYDGMWIAGGWLGGLPYEESQRKGIVDRFIERGVEEDRIVQIDGKDTVDKVRELMNIYEIESDGSVGYLGIASYPLHIARFNLALMHAQQEGYGESVEIIGIPTGNEKKPKSDRTSRPLGDWVVGLVGLIKDARRLKKHGFSESVPGQNSEFHNRLKALNSEDRFKDR